MNKSKEFFLYLNIFLKITLILSFIIALVLNTPYLQSKGMAFRAPFFIGATLILPAIAYIRKWKNYPHLADALITLPFVLDTLGNIFGLFDSIVIYDDALHALNWLFFIIAYHLLRFRTIQDKRDAFLLGFGIGVITIVLWEIIEWVLSVDGFGTLGGLKLSYNDTIGDLATSSIGGLVGSFIGVAFFSKSKS